MLLVSKLLHIQRNMMTNTMCFQCLKSKQFQLKLPLPHKSVRIMKKKTKKRITVHIGLLWKWVTTLRSLKVVSETGCCVRHSLRTTVLEQVFPHFFVLKTCSTKHCNDNLLCLIRAFVCSTMLSHMYVFSTHSSGRNQQP